jgi:hypothetical protein
MSTTCSSPDLLAPTICDLAWEDVVFPNILPCLSIKDCFSLRAASKECQTMVDEYFKKIRRIDMSKDRCLTDLAFNVSNLFLSLAKITN